VVTADLDWDGDMDVISSSRRDDRIEWYENLLGEGCTDSNACNYNPDSFIDNGSCFYEPCLNIIDSNSDGFIGIEDLLEFVNNIGCTGQDCFGDYNGDNVVNSADMLKLMA